MPNVEKNFNGVEANGSKEEISDFCEDVSDVVEEENVKDEEVEKFNDWKLEETDTNEDMVEKTAEVNSKSVCDDSNTLSKLKMIIYRFEKFIYSKLMLKTNLYYFDSENLSAEIDCNDENDEANIKVTTNNDDLKEKLRKID